MVVTLGRSLLAHQAEIELRRVTYACDLVRMCVKFQEEILLRGKNVKPRKIRNFQK